MANTQTTGKRTRNRFPLTDDRLEEMWEADTTSADDCKSLYYFKVVARAIEAAHDITGEQK